MGLITFGAAALFLVAIIRKGTGGYTGEETFNPQTGGLAQDDKH
jgi:hypothetical protein